MGKAQEIRWWESGGRGEATVSSRRRWSGSHHGEGVSLVRKRQSRASVDEEDAKLMAGVRTTPNGRDKGAQPAGAISGCMPAVMSRLQRCYCANRGRVWRTRTNNHNCGRSHHFDSRAVQALGKEYERNMAARIRGGA